MLFSFFVSVPRVRLQKAFVKVALSLACVKNKLTFRTSHHHYLGIFGSDQMCHEV